VMGMLEHQSSFSKNEQRTTMLQIAEVTGGQALFPTSVNQLDEMYDKIVARSQDPLLNQAHGPDMNFEADVDGIVQRLRAEQQAARSQELMRRIDANEATEAEVAEYAGLLETLKSVKTGNPPTEERSDF